MMLQASELSDEEIADLRLQAIGFKGARCDSPETICTRADFALARAAYARGLSAGAEAQRKRDEDYIRTNSKRSTDGCRRLLKQIAAAIGHNEGDVE